MPVATFDTLKFANTLKAAGVPPQQAEAQAVAFAEVIQLNLKDLVTKDDLNRGLDDLRKDLSAEIAEVRKDLSAEIAEVRKDLSAEIAEVREDMNGGIAEVRKDMNGGIAGLRRDLSAEIADARKDSAAGIADARKDAKHDLKEAEQRLTARIELVASKIDANAADLRAGMTLLRWMIGVNAAVIVATLGFVLRFFIFRGVP